VRQAARHRALADICRRPGSGRERLLPLAGVSTSTARTTPAVWYKTERDPARYTGQRAAPALSNGGGRLVTKASVTFTAGRTGTLDLIINDSQLPGSTGYYRAAITADGGQPHYDAPGEPVPASPEQ
jgi:hypothetical protein